MRRLVCCLLALFVIAGCSTEVEGPEPGMDDDPEDLSTDPSFVCNEAHPDEGTWVTLDGEAFSPLVVDALADEDEPDVELPVVTLVLREGPAGEEVETERFELESPLGQEDGRIRWLDDETLQFKVSDDLELPEGVYEIEVENPNGEVAIQSDAFGVLDRPQLQEAIPEMTCIEQDEREITLEGDNFLVEGDEDEIPTMRVDGETVEVVEDSTSNCRELHETFTSHRVCEELTVRLDQEQFEAGVYDVTAENFDPAGCASDPEEDGVTVTVNAPPEVDDVTPSPICSEQIEYEAMEVDGDEFVTVEDDDGETIYPEVEFGDRTYEAVDATGCQEVDSAPALGAQRCDQLLVDVDDGDLADQVADDVTHEDLETVVTNPDPVGCHSTQEEYLTAMPRPQVDVVEPDPMCTSQYENSFVVEGHGFAEIDGDQPVVHIEDETYEVDADALDGCTDIETPDVQTRSCEELTVTIPEGDLEVERNDVTVENPETAQCESTDDSTVQIVPPPTVGEVTPQPVCTDQNERTLEIDGEDFLDIDGELPQVAIGDQDFDSHELQDCQELPVDDEERSIEQCGELLVNVAPEDELEADVHDVVVTNPEGAQCHSEQDVTVETVPPPTVASIGPTPVCSEQVEYEAMSVDGDDFVVVRDDDGQERFPEVSVGTNSYDAVEAGGCEEIETDVEMETERCTELMIDVGDGDLADQVDAGVTHEQLGVNVTNPDPVGCESFDDDVALTATPPPQVHTVDPDPMCTEQFANTFEIGGHGFLEIEGSDPTVHVEDNSYDVEAMDGCTALPEDDAYSCETVSVTIPEGDIDPQEADVRVENPETAQCESTEDSSLRIVSRPTVEDAEPQPVCAANDTHNVTVSGSDFLNIDGELPEVSVGAETFGATDVDGCTDISVNDDTRDVQQCSSLTVEVGPGLADDEMMHDVVVTNPDGAACSSTDEQSFATLPRPEIASVQPRAICEDEGEQTYEVDGDHFYEYAGTAPVVQIDNQSIGDVTTDSCESVDDDIDRCERLEFSLDPSAVNEDITDIVVANPAQVGCSSDQSDPLVVAGSPQIDGTQPDVACEDEEIDGNMTLHGRFLYEDGGEQPDVTFDGETASETVKPDSIDDCTSSDAGDFTINECEQLTATVPEPIRDEDFEITVSAVDPVACGSDTIEFQRNPEPTVDNVQPQRICEDGGTLTVSGQNLMEDADYFLDGTQPVDVEYHSHQEVDVTFGNLPTTGEMEFEVINPGECGTTYEETIRSIDGPNPVYVDPPAVFNEMETQVTIYAAGLDDGSIDDIEFYRPDGTTVDPIDWEVDDERPSVVQATTPSGMIDDDEEMVDFGVRLTEEIDDEHSCSNETDEIFTVTGELTVAVDEIEPDFGGADETTSVDITALEEDELGDDEVQFEATPRVYLNPDDTAGDEDIARELQSMQFIDETELNALVPDGLPVGDYDVVVVNPDGQVGVLFADDDEGFEVTEFNAPRIASVSPTSWTTNEDALYVEVEGEYFQQGLDVDVFCRPEDGDDLEEDELDQPSEITIDTVEHDYIDMFVDTNDLEQLSTCFMRVTNPDGNFGEYSPITVTNPAGNFVEWSPDEPFDTPRRAPTLFSGTPGDQASFLYVVGGDDGADGDTVYADGEYTRLDQFGEPGEWDELPFSLPTGRTLANGIRIDDFLYLVGGYDGATGEATDKVMRARVLDPRDVPEIVGIDIIIDDIFDDFGGGGDDDDSEHFEEGTYYYQVSALYSDDDPANPGGESLPSEPQPVEVPELTDEVTISWDAPDQAPDEAYDIAGWQVYRTVEPDDPFGDETELATITDPDQTSFTDDATETPEGDEVLPLGVTGTWHQVSELETERMVAGITAAENPEVDDEHFIYAVGGEDATGEHLADYEFVDVDVDGPRQQEVADQATVGLDDDREDPVLLGDGGDVCPRAELTASTADDSNAPSLSEIDAQVFTIGGKSEGDDCNDDERDLYVSTVTAEGHLEEWTLAGNRFGGSSRYGHAGTAVADQAALVGGTDGEPDDTGRHSDFECDTDDGCPPTDFETSWSSLSQMEMTPRVWMGHLSFRGIWYLAGGETETEAATNSVESSPP